MFNAFNGSNSLKIALTTGSGETTSCSKDDFETDNLSFMDVSNQSSVSPGRYIRQLRNGTNQAFICM